MMTAILYINDNNLLLQQGANVADSQGYAWLKDGDVIFDDAVAQCRVEPQQINNRYWQQCDQSAISVNQSGMRHAADLVWRHLSHIKQQHALEQLAFVTPSHYQTSNLQLLLGITKSCGLEVTRLINKAVLALQNQVSAEGHYMHIDLQLHQTVCTELQATDGMLKLTSVDVLHEVSIQAMQDALLKAMQHCFIQSDRFDPLHYAETEQQLFSQIPSAAAEIVAKGKASLLVEHRSKLHTVTIDAKQWNAALQPFFKQLSKTGSSEHLLHSYLQLNRIFEDAAVLPLKESRLTVLSDRYTVQPVQIMAAEAESGELVYITELPLLSSPLLSNQAATISETAQLAPVAPDTQRPALVPATPLVAGSDSKSTHLLQAGLAVPLEQAHIETQDNNLVLSYAPSSNAHSMLQAGQLFVMSDPQRNTIQPNDRLGSNLAEGVITVIQVLE